MALGATGADVLWLLVGDSLRPVLIGLAIGLIVALAAGRVFASVLAGISPHDPVAIVVALVMLLAGALVAVIVPARRAARTDPARVLRQA
jgi:ABC-type antimicrobial peptide transport system permease subunit